MRLFCACQLKNSTLLAVKAVTKAAVISTVHRFSSFERFIKTIVAVAHLEARRFARRYHAAFSSVKVGNLLDFTTIRDGKVKS